MKKHQLEKLKERLDELNETISASEHRDNDPVSLAWTYDDPADQELAALVAACVAYGRVSLVRDAGRRIMAPLGTSPTQTLLSLDLLDLERAYEGYVYRMTKGEDVVDLLWGARSVIDEFGALEDGYKQSAAKTHIERASDFVQLIRGRRARKNLERGLKYLLTDPADGSTAKRLHLFFRWVGRGPDELDLGLWESLDARDLVMPLDTHTSRICRYIGLLERKSLDSKAAQEVSRNLSKLAPEDPLIYDFPICHLGISGGCIHKRSDEHCPKCPLDTICTLE